MALLLGLILKLEEMASKDSFKASIKEQQG